MGAHYTGDYHAAIAKAGETDAESRWRTQRERITRYKQGGSILDIGCSSGSFLSTLPKDAWQLHGIEMESSTAERARLNTGAEVFVGEALDAPFPPESFDVVTCFDVLEHVYDPKRFLAKVLEWLRPGGIFCTQLPNIASWESRLFGSYWYGLELPRHLFHFSPQSLRHVTRSLGFEELFLTTRACYVERSVGYVYLRLLERLGGTPPPPAAPRQQSFAWKATRRVLRYTVIWPFGLAAALAGAGASIEAVFAKPSKTSPNPDFDPAVGKR
jgi:2-polyprenyl-3-methyl-5-hydroxy-6-metoxy-1,4-benzoquinol methylase